MKKINSSADDESLEDKKSSLLPGNIEIEVSAALMDELIEFRRSS